MTTTDPLYADQFRHWLRNRIPARLRPQQEPEQ